MVNELALANVPVPLEVQETPLLFDVLEPAVIFTAPEFEQVDTAVPAVEVAGALILMVLVVLTAEQPPSASDVSVRVIVPLKVPNGV